MPQTNLGAITDIRLMPLHRVWFIAEPPPAGWTIAAPPAAHVVCNALQLGTPEAESSLRIDPVVRRTGRGGDRMVAWALTGRYIFPVGRHTDMERELRTYTRRPVSVKLQLGGYGLSGGVVGWNPRPDPPGYETWYLYLTALDTFDARMEMNYAQESVELRLRWSVQFSGLVPTLETIMTQNDTWWW